MTAELQRTGQVTIDAPVRNPRWAVVDLLRGVAIVSVVAFHLTWDLGDLGLISWRISAHWSGKVTAHSIAGSFLFLVGVSLVLAHRRGIRWRAFCRRELQLVVLALVITAASAVYQPREIVTFGILHAIAVVSLLALLAVRAPRWVPWALAAVSVALPWLVHLPGRSPWISWTGLADGTQPSLDWQPVLPWIALAFVGIGVMRPLVVAAEGGTTVAGLRSWRPASSPTRGLGWLGRHTLAIYVLHQPVLYGALWLLA
jgi:Predicted membrane protein